MIKPLTKIQVKNAKVLEKCLEAIDLAVSSQLAPVTLVSRSGSYELDGTIYITVVLKKEKKQ